MDRVHHNYAGRVATRTVLVAPDSFKGSLAAVVAAEAIAVGWREVRPDDHLVLLPQADGGEGTIDAIEAAVPGAVRHSVGLVTGPDGRPTPGVWLALPDGTAVVELALSSGLGLMLAPDPLGATTRGLGQVLLAALDAGASSIVIGLGGSASTDAATGALTALGLRLLDAAGEPLPDGGAALAGLATIDRAQLVPPPGGGVTLLADVTAPLTGPTGAAAVFGPQKGASPAQVARLEAAMRTVAERFGGDPAAPGSGAAGGAGYGFATVWGATMTSGADRIAELSGLEAALAGADIVITGEGRFDEQSVAGKAVGRLLERAAAHRVTAGVIAGQVSVPTGVWTASLEELAGSIDAALDDPVRWLRLAGAEAARAL
jgi:glycerate kinase